MKSKIGLQIGFLACIIFLVAQFGGIVPLTLLVGYVLVCENNDFLRMSALKAFLLVLFVSLIGWLLGSFSNIFIDAIDGFIGIFSADFSLGNLAFFRKIFQILNFIAWIVSTCKAIVLVLLAYLALRIKTIKLPLIDNLIDKYAGKAQQ